MKLVFFIFLLISIAEARPQQNNEEQLGFDGITPFDKSQLSIPKTVRQNRFELSIESNTTSIILEEIQRKQDLLDGLYHVDILQKPLFKTLKTVDIIYLHPNFLTTIMFPQKYSISKPMASFKTNFFEFSNNTIRIQPAQNSPLGNIVLSLTDGKQNYSINIFVKKFIQDVNCINKKCKQDFLATVIKYQEPKKLNHFQVIEEYLVLNSFKKVTIEKNLDYVSFSKNGETFYIIRDDEFGNIFKDGLSLKIKTSL